VTDTETLAEVKARFLKSKNNRKLWDETEAQRGVGKALALYRHERGLSQKDIAERTGWDKGFVSRLEGAQGGVPETKTLARYVEACGARLGVVIVDEKTPKTGRARILEVMSDAPQDRQLVGEKLAVGSLNEQWTESDGRHRDKDGEIQRKRSDTMNKNLSRPIPQFSPTTTLGEMRKRTGKESENAVRRAAAKMKV
jgi:transcriptional regulator with XRE-family HTH domain